jgi:hypothetical protein
MSNYTVYVNPYLVLRSGGYTKHYYIESQRIVSSWAVAGMTAAKGPLRRPKPERARLTTRTSTNS